MSWIKAVLQALRLVPKPVRDAAVDAASQLINGVERDPEKRKAALREAAKQK